MIIVTFPDPDLVPLRIEETWVEEIRKSLPELPDEKKGAVCEGLRDSRIRCGDPDLDEGHGQLL